MIPSRQFSHLPFRKGDPVSDVGVRAKQLADQVLARLIDGVNLARAATVLAVIVVAKVAAGGTDPQALWTLN